MKSPCTLLTLALVLLAAPLSAQTPPPPAQGNPVPPRQGNARPGIQGQRGRGQGVQPGQGPNINIRELQEMFDAYALVQAQRVLQLDDQQYPRFFVRMNRLQDLRRQHQMQRLRLLNELRRMTAPDAGDEAALEGTVRKLDELDANFAIQLRNARLAIDEVLGPRQRARFRFFEEEMERQKLDFITRSRQGRGPGLQ